MDQIHIENLEVYGHHGVFREENVLGQKFLVSVVLYLDAAGAAGEDDLSLSVNYGDVAWYVEEQMKAKTCRLIETVAQHLAEGILIKFPQVRRVCIEVKKPWAPVLLPLDYVSVQLEREWTRVYLSLGSNMGDRKKNIEAAVRALQKDEKIRNVTESALIETKPYGYTDQDDFLNMAVGMETIYPPQALLSRIHEIEEEGHRERIIHWGPRTIDLDILLYGGITMGTPELTIPHKEMHLRDFVLQPLAEIAPWEVHPVFHKTIYELYQEREGQGL